MFNVKGYRPIPGFSKYLINKDGEAIVILSKEKVLWHWSNGYKFSKLVSDNGVRVSIGQHRALALAFIPIPDDLKGKIIVNHKDSLKHNNKLENLEWCSYSENNKHAYEQGKRLDNIELLLVNKLTKEKRTFNTIKSCCQYLKTSYESIIKIINGKKQSNYDIKIIRNKDYSYKEFTAYGVCARNIETKQILIAKDPTDLGKLINVHRKVISRILKAKRFQYPTNGFDIRVFQKDIIWPEYTKEEILAYKDLKFIHQPVFIIKDNIRKLFGSIVEASKFTSTNERSIRFSIQNSKKCVNGYSYEKHTRNFEINK